MTASVPDAAELARALLPTDEARVLLCEASKALEDSRKAQDNAQTALHAALRACNRAREALLRHQSRPGAPSTPDPGGLY